MCKNLDGENLANFCSVINFAKFLSFSPYGTTWFSWGFVRPYNSVFDGLETKLSTSNDILIITHKSPRGGWMCSRE